MTMGNSQSQKKDFEILQNGNILKFKDASVFEATVKKLKSMSFDQQVEWHQSVQFKPLYSFYLEALKRTNEENLDYAGILYFPEYKDDYGIYLPVSTKEYALLLNAQGEVMIGEEVHNFEDIKDYESLQKTGNALYSKESVSLRADGLQNVYEGDYIGTQYISNWNERPISNQRTSRSRFKLGRYVTQPSDISWLPWIFQLEVDVRIKLSSGEWVTTSGQTSLDGFIALPGNSNSSLGLMPFKGMGPYPQSLYMTATSSNSQYPFDNKPGSWFYNERIAYALECYIRVICVEHTYDSGSFTLPEQKYCVRL